MAGKVVLITGGTGGIGKATAIGLAATIDRDPFRKGQARQDESNRLKNQVLSPGSNKRRCSSIA